MSKEDSDMSSDADPITSGGNYTSWYEVEAAKVCRRNRRATMPHENCNQFYRCLGRKPSAQSCGEGRLYDTTKRACGSDKVVQCWERRL